MESDIQKLFRIGDLIEIQTKLEADPTLINKIDNKFNWTPLYRSVLCEHEAVIDLLLSHGADADISNKLGEVPLH
jgi:ankyrin repeat protein